MNAPTTSISSLEGAKPNGGVSEHKARHPAGGRPAAPRGLAREASKTDGGQEKNRRRLTRRARSGYW
jgi:hypothetical protein